MKRRKLCIRVRSSLIQEQMIGSCVSAVDGIDPNTSAASFIFPIAAQGWKTARLEALGEGQDIHLWHDEEAANVIVPADTVAVPIQRVAQEVRQSIADGRQSVRSRRKRTSIDGKIARQAVLVGGRHRYGVAHIVPGVKNAVSASLYEFPVAAVIDGNGIHHLGESHGQTIHGLPGTLPVRRQRLNRTDPGLDIHVPFDGQCPTAERALIPRVVVRNLQRPHPYCVEAIKVR